LDLRNWDFVEAPIAPLAGEWDIYWGKLLEPIQSEGNAAKWPEPAGPFVMPAIWNDWPSAGDGVGGLGYATFRVTVLLPPELQGGALRLRPASTAYRLWANGELIASSGEPTDRSSTRPHYRVSSVRYQARDGELELVLQVANFHHRRGGMWQPIEIGSVASIESKHFLEGAYDLLLIGSFVGLLVHNLLAWRFSERRSRTSLYLALLFGVLSLRVAMMGQMMVTRVFPGFPWGVQLRIEYLTAYLALLSLSLVLFSIYPRIITKRVTLFAGAITALNTLSVVIMPTLVYSRLVRLYVYAMIAVLAAELTLLVFALIRGRGETWAGILAVTITLLITLGETIHYHGWILSRDFAPFGFLITAITGDSLNQSTLYLISSGFNLVLVFIVANYLAVRGSRSLVTIGNRERGALLPAGIANAEVRNAAAKEPHIVTGPQTATTKERTQRLRSKFGLTGREVEVAALAAGGLSNKEIAGRLYVSETTVKKHMYRILRKVGVGNRTELSRRYFS
jgi:DNA-binding CsgD family transcriptional regulator